MLRSLYSGVSGLQAHQTKMDVIGNNIANVNTNGYKASRVVFSDVYYQTLASAAAPTATSGGINATQIGYGSTVASIDILNTRAGMETTNRALDLYISGDGYFQVQDGAGNEYYSRVGNFKFDLGGNLVDSNGMYVIGGQPSMTGTIGEITVANIAEYSNVAISKDGTITGLNTTTNTIDSLGQIALTKFTNADGLLQNGNSYYTETVNSGAPTLVVPGTGATGSLVPGALEMSNVDLSKEFTDMITTQRGFQANSRIITTSDEMLEELVNLKR